MSAAAYLLKPFHWSASFFSKYVQGKYSIPMTVISAFLLFSLNTILMDITEFFLQLLSIPDPVVKIIKASLLAFVVVFLHIGIWFSCATAYWWFRLCVRLFIINNIVVVGVFLVAAFGIVRVDSQVMLNNPNVPSRIR